MSHRPRLCVLCFAIALTLRAGFAMADPPYEQHQDVVYGDVHGVGLLMDVFVPTGKKNGRAIVDIASGAWHSDRSKIRDHQFAQTFDLLCKRGFVVFAIRPGSITKFNAPEMLENVRTGIRWVKRHAEEYQIDPAELGLMGASAGGHLACLAAVTADDATRVSAVAVFFPPTDFLNYGGKPLDPNASDGVGRMLAGLAFPRLAQPPTEPEAITAAIKAISPAHLVTADAPPFLLIHGDADQAVPLQQSEVMRAALQAQKVPATLIVKEGGGHPWLTIHEEVALLADWFVDELTQD